MASLPQDPKPSLIEFEDYTYVADVEEWISLVAMQSPRVQANDSVDPYLCRYAIPDCDITTMDGQPVNIRDLVLLRWHGFLPSHFVIRVLLAARKVSSKQHQWATLTVHGFHDKTLTGMKLSDTIEDGKDAYLEWQH